MRSAVAILLAALMLVLAFAPHTHAGVHGDHACAACLARNVEPARSAAADLVAPQDTPAEVVATAVTAPPAGAPLGAVPGQSPPPDA